MVTSPWEPGYYSLSNLHLLAAAREDAQPLAERWMDEISESALSGNPKLAGYIEHMAMRHLAWVMT